MVSVRWYPSRKTLEVRPRTLQVIAGLRVVMVAVEPTVENFGRRRRNPVLRGNGVGLSSV